ncbi:MAG: PA2169 family four-helix-bundle protein [Planctomycetota bacterium]|nr:PA2169 family four-helix-bundle protein [Planctomycetota bacterium]
MASDQRTNSDKLRVTEGDQNRDPLSGERGAHPVGAGAGAAVGATVGGAIGTVGGPIGVAAGAAIGGIIGGYAGKGTAELINPTGEVDYWRQEFPKRGYSAGRRFEDYEPAYSSTVRAYSSNPGRSFDDVEGQLEKGWSTARGKSTLAWHDVRDASRDAWDRLRTNVRPRAANANNPEKAADKVNDLIELLHDGAAGFSLAAENVKNSSVREALLSYSRQREQYIAELKPLVSAAGENPEDSGSTLGSVHRGWLDLRHSISGGDHAILSECERGEDKALDKYRELLESEDVTPEFRVVLQRQLAGVQDAHDAVKRWRDSLA